MMWFYVKNGAQAGPVSWEYLVGLARTGSVAPGDLVWTEGMAQWQAASTIPGLVPPPAAAPPPLPAQPVQPAPGAYPASYPAATQPAYAAPGGYPAANYPAASYPAPGMAPAPGARPYPQAPTMGDDAAMRMLLPVGRSIWAIFAGYLGLLSLLGIFGPPALICGLVALHDIKKHPHLHGAGRAWFGIVMGALGSVALVAGIVMALNAS